MDDTTVYNVELYRMYIPTNFKCINLEVSLVRQVMERYDEKKIQIESLPL